MTPRDLRLVLGWERGTAFEEHLAAAVRVASWDELTLLARGWPDIVQAALYVRDYPEQAQSMARRG